MFERFKNFQNQNDFWIADDYSFAITCPTNLDNVRLNLTKPHPSAKQIEKLYNGDMMSLNHKGKNVYANIAKLVPSNSGIALFLHSEATKDSKKQIWLSFSSFKNSRLTKIHITPSGRINDNHPIFK
jgi:hypothetical protein